MDYDLGVFSGGGVGRSPTPQSRRPPSVIHVSQLSLRNAVERFTASQHCTNQSWTWVGSIHGSGRFGSQNSSSWVGRIGSGPVSTISTKYTIYTQETLLFDDYNL